MTAAPAGASAPTDPPIRLEEVTVGYDARVICERLSATVPEHSFTAIIGPNACGKSTLLRTMARILAPAGGRVVLDGRDVQSYGAKELARRMGLLPQSSLAPDGIRVVDLVARGRFPHHGLFRQWSEQDREAVVAALHATGTTELSGRPVDELSGGQRQRVWVAMLLAQQTRIMLLDEPTTFLDIGHQYELLELFRDLHRQGRTVVAVLHDLNQAARYATDLVVLHDGRVAATGTPREVITPELVERVFGLRCTVVPDPDPVTGTPAVFPLGPRESVPAARPTTTEKEN